MPESKETRTFFPLPSPIDDGSRLCVQLSIPNIPGHRQAFLGAIFNLTRWYSWERDSEKQGRLAAAVWDDIFSDLLATFYDGCGCDDQCYTYGPDAQFIEWFPNNPYTEPDLVTAGYNFPAWYLATPISNTLLGTQPGDVVTDLTRFPPGSLPTVIPASGLPRFRINLPAPGLVRLYLTNILAGSLAQITIDDDTGSVEFVDLDKDVLSIPPETNDVVIVEKEITTPGAHHIDVIIVSWVNESLPFLHHGGALRKIEICGEAAQNMPYFELRQNPDNPCIIEQKTTVNGEFFTAYDLSLCQPAPGNGGGCGDCEDEMAQEFRTNPANPCQLQMRSGNCGEWVTIFDAGKCGAGTSSKRDDKLANQQRKYAYNGTPTSINPNTPANFNGNAGDTATKALCTATKGYVYKSMINFMQTLADALGDGSAAPVWAGIFSPLWYLMGGISTISSTISFNNALAAFQNDAAMESVICQLYNALKTLNTTQANLQTAVNGLSSSIIDEMTIIQCLQEMVEAAYIETNYLLFLDMLGEANRLAALGEYDCPCVDDVDPLECGDVLLDFRTGVPSGARIDVGVQIGGQGVRTVAISGTVKSYDVWIEFSESCSRDVRYKFHTVTGGGNRNYIYFYRRNVDGTYTLNSSTGRSSVTGENTDTIQHSGPTYDAIRIATGPYNVETTLREVEFGNF